MWHYVEGIHNWNPIWPDHAIRIIPGPSSLWLDATGRRLPPPNFPGFDTLRTLREILATGYDYSWFVLTQTIIEKEFALSGSEQNPDITGKDLRLVLRERLSQRCDRAGRGVQAARRRTSSCATTCASSSTGMNALGRGATLELRAASSARSSRATARSATGTPRTRR